MKLYNNIRKEPLLLSNDGRLINLNTLEYTTETDIVPVKAGKELKISKHRNQKFLDNAGKIFNVSKIAKFHGNGWYKLESNITLFCIIQGDTVQLLGHYPIYILKLVYRYIQHSL